MCEIFFIFCSLFWAKINEFSSDVCTFCMRKYFFSSRRGHFYISYMIADLLLSLNSYIYLVCYVLPDSMQQRSSHSLSFQCVRFSMTFFFTEHDEYKIGGRNRSNASNTIYFYLSVIF